jgi:ornithine cyclodeaminase/alanine dehydrogenase-like protein (mu-crystallin family)
MTSVGRRAQIISSDVLRANVGFQDLIASVALAFQASSAGKAQSGLVTMFPADRPDRGDVYVKTGSVEGAAIFIVKVSPWFAANVENGCAQGGFVAVFDAATGHTRAILDDQHYLSDIRTAAAGALAARVLAPAAIITAAVLGAGVQAYWQVVALFHERPFKRMLIWAREGEKAQALAARLKGLLHAVDIEIVGEVETAVRRADVLITATSSREPIVRGEWMRPGQHVTAVGADDATKCELDALALNRARVFVDERQTALANGDVYRAVSRGEYQAQAIAGEIGDVLAGRIAGRRGADEITIAKFVGLGVQDLAAAQVAVETLERQVASSASS